MNSLSRFHFPSLLIAAALFFAATPGRAEEFYVVGSTVAPFTAQDQFGAPFRLDAECHALLISFDMATGKQANLRLSSLGGSFLPKHRAIYVANIYGMPAIGRIFALPKMRSYAHRIVLADSATLLARFPRKDKRVTVLTLRNGKVTAIHYWDPEKEKAPLPLGL